MTASARALVNLDREHLIHSLHHPIDHAEPVIYARGSGVMVEDVCGITYIDGLSGLWNVNVGYGRAELRVVPSQLARFMPECGHRIASQQ